MSRSLRRRVNPSTVSVPRGYAVSGMEFASTTLPGTEGQHFTKGVQNDYTYYANKGLVLARVAFLWERAQPTVGGALDATYMGYMDDICDFALNAGVKILWEPHNFGGRDVSGTPRKVGNAQLTTAHFADFWTKIVQHYLDDPTRLAAIWGWDLMNEPADMPTPTTTSNYNTTSSTTLMNQAGIDAIRAIDATRYIVAEQDQYAGLQAFTTLYGNNPAPWLIDSSNKLYYSWHYYFDSNHSGAYTGANASFSGSGLSVYAGGNYLETVAQWAIDNNVLINGDPAIFVGEYGVTNETASIGGSVGRNDEGYLSALNDLLNVMDAYNIPGCHWASGQWYHSATALSPGLNYTSDREQMKIISKHLGTLS